MTTATSTDHGEMMRSDPMTEFARLTQPLTDPFGEQWPNFSAVLNRDGFTPLADIEDNDGAYVVDVELPGANKSDINVEVVEQRLIVSGERREADRSGRLRHRARGWGRFYFEVRLPERVQPGNVKATLKDGVLHLEVPKNQTEGPRRVEIQDTKDAQ
ncbi:MAG TPA: Hsp20/alpha crystallin family protein [Mycobacteriales bacterium]|nr:Hsp20/alpha crystallin family protein [Mycobacteriales bacterium]